jgi:hypothetical protein
VPNDRWIFVKQGDIIRPDIDHYYINRNENVTIIKNSTVINNTYIDKSRNVTYNIGPQKDEVQKITGKEIKTIAIKESNQPGQNLRNNELEIYRPVIQKTSDNGKKPAPAKVADLNQIKPVSVDQTNNGINEENTNSQQNNNNNAEDNNHSKLNKKNIDNNNMDSTSNTTSDKNQKKIQRQNKRKQINSADSTSSPSKIPQQK